MNQVVIAGRHMGIPVLNLDLMKNFYINLLGFKVKTDEIEEGEFISKILGINNSKVHVIKMIAPDGWMLELLFYLNISRELINPSKKVSDIGFAHMALTVNNIDESYNFLISNNVNFICSPKLSPSGKAKVCFCQDPEGNYIELVEVFQ